MTQTSRHFYVVTSIAFALSMPVEMHCADEKSPPASSFPDEDWDVDEDGNPKPDGLTNEDEAAVGTDPFNPDTDGDELLDGEEAVPLNPIMKVPAAREVSKYATILMPEGYRAVGLNSRGDVLLLPYSEEEQIHTGWFFREGDIFRVGNGSYWDFIGPLEDGSVYFPGPIIEHDGGWKSDHMRWHPSAPNSPQPFGKHGVWQFNDVFPAVAFPPPSPGLSNVPHGVFKDLIIEKYGDIEIKAPPGYSLDSSSSENIVGFSQRIIGVNDNHDKIVNLSVGARTRYHRPVSPNQLQEHAWVTGSVIASGWYSTSSQESGGHAGFLRIASVGPETQSPRVRSIYTMNSERYAILREGDPWGGFYHGNFFFRGPQGDISLGGASLEEISEKITPEGPYAIGSDWQGAGLWCYNDGQLESFLVEGGNTYTDGYYPRPPARLISKNLVFPTYDGIWRNGRIRTHQELLGNNVPNSNNFRFIAISPENDFLLSNWEDHEVGGEHYGLHFPADLAVDANRDGFIKFGGNSNDANLTGKPMEKTSETQPFRFWINNDNDGLPNSEGDFVGTQSKDYEDGTIQTARDLEDFARLHLHIGWFYEQIASGTFKIGLKWRDATDTPKIKVYKSTDTSGSDSYLKDEQAAFDQVSGDDIETLGEAAGATAMILPAEFWTGYSEENPKRCLLFEGSGEGKGQLVLTIHKSDGTEIGEGPGVWLDLKNVRKMYQRGKAVMPDGSDNVPSPFDFGNPQPPDPGMVNVANPDGNNFEQHWDEKHQTIVFVHGWRMPYNEAIGWGDTMFKRLWHRGFKGRFATFRWPTYTGLPPFAKYNESEYRAWKSGGALKQFVTGLPYPEAKNICAHSMGNIVVGSALQQGMSVTNYILMQAAVPSGAYNVSQANFRPFVDKDAADPTPDGIDDLGYRGFLGSISGNLVNFYNDRDEALRAWNINNAGNGVLPAFKPNRLITATQSYGYNPTFTLGQRCSLVGFSTDRQVLDHHESMALVARSRTITVGRESTNGSVDGNNDLDGAYNFAGDHSAQWDRVIQDLKPFFNRMLEEYDIPSNP